MQGWPLEAMAPVVLCGGDWNHSSTDNCKQPVRGEIRHHTLGLITM